METLLSKAEIPIIDLSHLGTVEIPVKSGVRRVAAQLHRSLSQKGLALLVNHGIPDEKIRTVYKVFDRFCEQPKDVHKKYMCTPPTCEGYVPPGRERFSEHNEKEMRHAFNITCLDRMLPEAEVPGFKEVVTSLAQDFRRLSCLLLRALAMALDLPCDYFLNSHRFMLEEGNATSMRLLNYPPFGAPPQPGVTRCGEHCDYGTFTLLAQDCEGGLEILTDKQQWGRVGHLPGSLLVNTGEILASWTRGKYPALRHRVVVPETSILRSRGRHSIAFFVHPDNDTPIQPIANAQTNPDADPAKDKVADAPPKKTQEKHNTIYTAYQHLQMRFRPSSLH